MPPRLRLHFYYDIGSPYSYFAYEILLRYEHLWNLDLQLYPVSRVHLSDTQPPVLTCEDPSRHS
jgi:glutathione S-transferase kappa 1